MFSPNQPNKPNPNRQGRPGRKPPGGGGRRPHDRRRGGKPGGKSGGKRPTMAGLIQSVAKGPKPEDSGLRRNDGRDRDTLKRFDNQDTGMLYPGGKLQEQPRTITDKQAKLRIIPLGGLSEVGLNCTAIEYGDDIIVIDVGWMFPDENMPGVDYVIPDVSYLEKKKQNIRGIVITHAHLDHIGGLRYILPKLGFPTLYATPFAVEMIKSSVEEMGILDSCRFATVKYSDKLRLGVFGVEFAHVNHNIPQGMAIGIDTPVGLLFHSGDFKFDRTPTSDEPAEYDKLKAFGDRGVLLALIESTNVERPGHTPSEQDIGKNLTEQIAQARGRVIMATFSTLVTRLQQAIWAAAENNRKVTVVGRSMLNVIGICQRLGYIDIPKDILVDPRDLRKYRDNELLILCTGSQANEMSALVRMSTGDHKQVQIKQGDTVILSSTPVPGNERAVGVMMDDLFRRGADVIYAKLYDIHSSGHAFQEELKEMLQMLRPKHFMPIHGEYRMRVLHGRLATGVGVDPANIHLLDNGSVLEANHRGDVGLTKEKAGGGLVLVDGLGVGDIGNVVLRDRKHMAEDGMFVIIITMGRKNGKLIGSPDIISRGFVFLRESGDLLDKTRAQVRKIVQNSGKGGKAPDANFLKNKLRDAIGDYLFDQTERRPMVLPVLIEV